MDNDDKPIGHILTRRDILKLLGITGAGLLVGCVPGLANTIQPASPAQAGTSTVVDLPPAAANPVIATASLIPACVVRPEATEGPYFVDEGLNRSDVRLDPSNGNIKDGVPFNLGFVVSRVGVSGCDPLEGARVEIWHCDAGGIYSDVADPRINTIGQKFLRGYQVTDGNGRAAFQTIYPGWYPGRTVHIHFKVIHASGSRNAVFTSQLFFDDALTDRVFLAEPYASRGRRDTLNSQDKIYKDLLLLNLSEAGAGYAGVFDIGLHLS